MNALDVYPNENDRALDHPDLLDQFFTYYRQIQDWEAKLNSNIPVEENQQYVCVKTLTHPEKLEEISAEDIDTSSMQVADNTKMESVTILKKEVKTEMWKQDETTQHFIDSINNNIREINAHFEKIKKLNTKKKSLFERWFAGGGHLEQLRADILNHEMETGQRDLEARRHFNALLRARRARD